MLVGAIDVNGDEPFQPEAYLVAGAQLYMGRDAMYAKMTGRGQRIGKTYILRFAISGTSITHEGIGMADGEPINQRSMDEYNGYLRIATIDWGIGNYVTVLDATTMSTVGRTEPFAPDEASYMHFMGDMGYVVTSRRTGLLYTIDMSDPYNPMILGELETSGYTRYLHPVGDGFLLGFGMRHLHIYNTFIFGGRGVAMAIDGDPRVSLFDVRDPFDPLEEEINLFDSNHIRIYDQRILTIDPSRNVYGLIYEIIDYGSLCVVLMLHVEDGEITVENWLPLIFDNLVGETRLCAVGEALYIVHDAGVTIYDHSTLEWLGIITF